LEQWYMSNLESPASSAVSASSLNDNSASPPFENGSGNVLEGLLGDSASESAFDSLAVEARSALPATWLARYGFAVVRRGYLIRQRADPAGRATAVDAVGPGGCFPLDRALVDGGARVLGYAVTRSMVCLCDGETLERGLLEGGPTALQVHQLQSEVITRMERLADARARPGAAAKIAALLCALADTLRPGSSRIPAEFLQRDLAGLVSIRHESVCRVLREFGRHGMITKDSDGIVLADRAQLQAV
jgi:CRP-like cAMP-binding protein